VGSRHGADSQSVPVAEASVDRKRLPRVVRNGLSLQTPARSYVTALFALTVLLAGCGTLPVSSPGASGLVSGVRPENVSPTAVQHIYWSLAGSATGPQIQYTVLPLRKISPATTVFANYHNELDESTGISVDTSGKRMWVLTRGKTGFSPSDVAVFDLPLTKPYVAIHRFVLSGTDLPTYLTFDSAGHLWVNSRDNNAVLEYTGPFAHNHTLAPHTKLRAGLDQPTGIAFDAHGDLYVSNFASTGSHSITVYKAPISSKTKPYFLDGLIYPGALAFDKDGNLYASTNGPSYSATVRYDSDDLKSGSFPSIVDRLGLYHAYGTSFAFGASGDLYVANCGSGASVFVYPTGEKPFSSKLPPSLDYTDYQIEVTRCVWGIAVR
jgi:hypothetical protein